MKKKGIWIDSNLSGRGLSPLDKFLYSQISYYSKGEGFCVKSDREFSIELEVSERSITTSLSFLVEKGLLEKQTDRSRGNYRELYPTAKTAEVLPQEMRNPTAKTAEVLPQEMRNPTAKTAEVLPQEMRNPTAKTAEVYKEETIIKQLNKQSINNSNNDFQKNENLAPAENLEIVEIIDFKGVTKKAPQAGGAGRKAKVDDVPELMFSESELFDFETFEAYMIEKYPEANVSYYYIQIRDWQNGDGSHPRRKNWKLVIKTFVTGDYAKGRLITKNHVGHEKTKQQSNQEQFADPYSLVNQYLDSL